MSAPQQIMKHLFDPQGPISDLDIKRALNSPHESIIKHREEYTARTVVRARVLIEIKHLRQLLKFLRKKKLRKLRRWLAREKRRLHHRGFIDLRLDDARRDEIEQSKKQLEARIRKIRALDKQIDIHQQQIDKLGESILEAEARLFDLDTEQSSIMAEIDNLFYQQTAVFINELREQLAADDRDPVDAIRARVDDITIDWEHKAIQAIARHLHQAISDNNHGILNSFLANQSQLMTYQQYCHQQVEALQDAVMQGDTLPIPRCIPEHVLSEQLREQMSFTQEIQMVGQMRHSLAPIMSQVEEQAKQSTDHNQQLRGFGGIRAVGIACRMGACLAKPYRQQHAEQALEQCRDRLVANHQQRLLELQNLNSLYQCLTDEHTALNACEAQLAELRSDNKRLVADIERIQAPDMSAGFF